MNIYIERFILIVLAATFAWVAYLMYHRKWEKCFSLAILLAFISAFSATGWFQGFFKTGVVSILITRLKDLGDEMNRYSQTTSDIRNELIDVSDKIRNQQATLLVQQSNVSESVTSIATREQQAQKTEAQLRQLADQLDAGRTALETTQAQIQEHQKKLEDVSALVKAVHEQVTTETMSQDESKKVLIGNKEDGSFGIAVRLSHFPIQQTVNARTQDNNILPTSMTIIDNAIFWKTTGSAEYLRKQQYIVSYVPDPTKQEQRLLDISVNDDGQLAIGGFVLNEYKWIDFNTNSSNKGLQTIGADSAPQPEP